LWNEACVEVLDIYYPKEQSAGIPRDFLIFTLLWLVVEREIVVLKGLENEGLRWPGIEKI
jgi:hypothetical protein